MSTPTSERIRDLRAAIEQKLLGYLPDPKTEASAVESGNLAPELCAAMRYATTAGGKRLRPLLCCAAAEAAGGCSTDALAAASALEFVHTYSLIHDDLPAMDDDSLRRGKPTCHIQYGEAEAILAGDALQALAFDVLATQALPAERCLAMVRSLSVAAGWSGMVGGQSYDLRLTTTSDVNQHQLEALHAAKTGALLTASIELGVLVAAGNDTALLAVGRQIGAHLGLAFQVIDDVLDVSQTSEVLGKDAGSDAEQGKTTFIDVLGEQGARDYAHSLFEEALRELPKLPGPTELLEATAREVVFRDH